MKLLLLIALVAGACFGQTGTLSGRVLDECGVFVPGAVVTVGALTVNAGGDDRYALARLAAGQYEVRAGGQ